MAEYVEATPTGTHPRDENLHTYINFKYLSTFATVQNFLPNIF